MPRDGTKNLKPVRTKDEAKKKGKNGGIKSGESRREKSTVKKITNIVLSADLPSENIKDAVRAFGVPESELNIQSGIAVCCTQKPIRTHVF